MSSQKSLYSFFSKKPQSENGSSEKSPSTPKENGCGGDGSGTCGKSRGGRTPVTSTPKRKKSETPANGKKKKMSQSENGYSKEIETEDSEIDVVEAESSKNGDSAVNATSESSFPLCSIRNSSTINESTDLNGTDTEALVTSDDFEHTKLDFLKAEYIRDLDKRRPDDDSYDPTTLYVPDHFLNKQTPVLREWWKFKSRHYDKILLLKVGKFYELYHMDAVTAVGLLNLNYMKGAFGKDKKRQFAHCGFPEISFGRYSDQLIRHGYKVARIEQTETPEMLEERNANTSGRKDKIVRRELCRIVTPGTKTYGYLDTDTGSGSARYLLALCEVAEGNKRRYGVCFVDCAVGKIWLSEYSDDFHSSRLRTMLAEYPPVEVLYTKKMITASTETVLNGLYSCKLEKVAWKKQFVTALDTLKMISRKQYFAVSNDGSSQMVIDDWPTVLRETLSEGDTLGTSYKKERELALSSLGAILWYLENCLIDDDIMTLNLFEWYEPTVNLDPSQSQANGETLPPVKSKTMILDSAALQNLDIIQSSSKTNSIEGTLLELLDTCSTAFGRRLLRHWLCNPLCAVDAIGHRQKAVKALLEQSEFVENASTSLKQMPDLERLLQSIHTIGLKKRLDHPDSRAVFFEEYKYKKRKADQFLSTLDGLHKILDITEEFGRIGGRIDSDLLKRLLLTDKQENGRFPDLRFHLNEIESKFDRQRQDKRRKRKKTKDDEDNEEEDNEGIVVLSADLEKITRTIDGIIGKFDSYLQKQRKKFNCSGIKYAQTVGKNRYLLEIPETVSSRLDGEYKFVGQIKGFRRYSTDRIEELLEELQKAEEQRDNAYQDSVRRIFEAFSEKLDIWRMAVEAAATLDVLLSLVRYAKDSEHTMCIPNVVIATERQKPFIEVVNGYHPCSAKIFTSSGQFVPNSTIIGKGTTDASVLLLTGPNMGGKSTLMRQVASLVVLAQLGSYVPAESCSLSVVDRIFTRLGATDRLSAGESTFAVELTETKIILSHATVHSLVVIDELGRGTATHDGAAIAYAVLRHLAGFQTGPRTLFSTHYHNLVARLRGHPNIGLGHTACTVENECDDPSEESVTFLYKLTPGACPKSYGFHAAKLAGIPKEIVKKAYLKAQDVDSLPDVANRLRKQVKEYATAPDDELVKAVAMVLQQ